MCGIKISWWEQSEWQWGVSKMLHGGLIKGCETLMYSQRWDTFFISSPSQINPFIKYNKNEFLEK